MSELFSCYEVRQNSDLTHGRGRMETGAYFLDEDDAYMYLQTIRHEQGSLSGKEICEMTFALSSEPESTKINVIRKKVWGHRCLPDNEWGYGWIDLRDLTEDYREYLRLKAIYE